MLFAERWNSNPFEVLNQDIDDFILIANSLIQKNNKTVAKSTAKPKEQRIRVNDKTATGGWW